MKFFLDVTVLTTHTAAAPLIAEFDIDRGIITEAGVYFPAGCNGLVFAKLYYQSHQILPRNQESWCHGNDGWWSEEAAFPVIDSPMTIKIEAYATGTIYNHTITIIVEVSPFAIVAQWDKVIKALEGIGEIIGVET